MTDVIAIPPARAERVQATTVAVRGLPCRWELDDRGWWRVTGRDEDGFLYEGWTFTEGMDAVEALVVVERYLGLPTWVDHYVTFSRGTASSAVRLVHPLRRFLGWGLSEAGHAARRAVHDGKTVTVQVEPEDLERLKAALVGAGAQVEGVPAKCEGANS